jgi:adenylate cyclase
MGVPEPERRLAAVVAADMVGYSRLMEVDETGTLARLITKPTGAATINSPRRAFS